MPRRGPGQFKRFARVHEETGDDPPVLPRVARRLPGLVGDPAPQGPGLDEDLLLAEARPRDVALVTVGDEPSSEQPHDRDRREEVSRAHPLSVLVDHVRSVCQLEEVDDILEAKRPRRVSGERGVEASRSLGGSNVFQAGRTMPLRLAVRQVRAGPAAKASNGRRAAGGTVRSARFANMESQAIPLGARPLDVAAASTERAAGRWLVALVAVGVLARGLRYGLGFALWEDEAFLVVNLFEKDYASLLGPLDFVQLAPPLWLLAEKALAELLGFSESSLRLAAFVSSLASLALFVALARRVLAGWEATVAVGLFAVSYPCVRYAAEAKPYGVDLLVSVGLLLAAVRLAEGARPARWLALAALLAVGPWLSFPSAFVGGGVVLLGLFRALGSAGPGHRVAAGAPWVAAGLLHASSLLAVQARIAAAAGPVLPGMQDFWAAAFPPLATPLSMPLWLLGSLTGPLLAFPAGGATGGSVVTTAAVLAGAVALARSSRPSLLAFCTVPFLLHLVAASLRRYPFGGHVKFSLYAAPLVSILAAASLSLLARRRPGSGRRSSLDGRVAAALLLVVGLGVVARDLAWPYKNPSDEQARSFAREFWADAARGAEAVCLSSDLGITFQPELRSRLSWFATYRANQILYSARHGRREAPRLSSVSAGRPLLVVEYKVGAFGYDEVGLRHWLDAMRENLGFVEEKRIPVERRDQHGRRIVATDEIVLRRFVPR